MRRKNNGLLLIIAFLLLALGVFWIFTSEDAGYTGDKKIIQSAFSTATPEPTATPEGGSYVVGADGNVIYSIGKNEEKEFEGTPEAMADFTAAPTDTPAPTPVVTETPTPSPTAEPTATPEPVYDKEGEFRSETGTYLNLLVKWSITPDGAGNYALKLDAYLESYALNCGSTDLFFTVDDSTEHMYSTPVTVDSQSKTESLIGSWTVSDQHGSLPVSVRWIFNGTISNQQIGEITASTTIYIP